MAFEASTDGTPTNGSNPWIDSLVEGGKWADADGGTVTITFAIQEGDDPYDFLSETFWGFEWFNYEIAALRAAMATWEVVANIDFVEAAADVADIWYWQTDYTELDSLGQHESPNFSSGEPLYGIFNYEGDGWDLLGLDQGGLGFVTLIHELGHALGLVHPHDGGDALDATLFPGVTSEFGDHGDYELNQGIWTTMSYNDGWTTQFPSHFSDWYGWQGTPMALDVAAVQAIYGANMGYKTGNDVYFLPLIDVSGTFWSCIWDAGGVDTISAEGAFSSVTINLNAAPLVGPNAGGFVSSVQGLVKGVVGGFTIASGVVIENAIGGWASDTLVGNAAANSLDGGFGADTMSGGAGDDNYFVDDAGDISDESGGSGLDTVHSSVTYSLSDAAHARGAIETLVLTGFFSINGTGNELANTISGNDGNNFLVGLGGADALNGGAGQDTLDGGLGNDLLTGGLGGDRFLFNVIGLDVINDFSLTDDTILLDNAIFAKLKKDGGLKKKYFEVGKKADDKDDFILYNKKTGVLSYDADGSKKKIDPIAFADLTDGLKLKADDFLVV